MNNILPFVYLHYSITTEKGFLDDYIIEMDYPEELTQVMEIIEWGLKVAEVNPRPGWKLEKVEVRNKNTRYVYK